MNAWMHVAGWVLVHFVWQGAVVAVAAATVLRLCRHQSASVRYAIASSAMVAMLLGVLATAVLIDAPLTGSIEDAGVSARVTRDGSPDVFLPIQINTAPSLSVSSAQRIEMILPWIVSGWLFGVTLLLIRAGAGWWRVRRLHQLALAAMHSAWQATGNRIASRLGIAGVVRIAELPHIDVPMVIGCLRPIVVLPIAAISQLNAAQVEAILAHELAHVRRHDYLVNLMQTLTETLLFYHPAVWWLSARIRDEREHCCDDVAVAVCGDPVGYAAALTEIEAWRSGELNFAVAATGGSLLKRVRRILRVEVAEESRISPWTLGVVVAGTVVGVTVNLIAQTSGPSAPRPKFEVAAVRPNTSGSNQVKMGMQPGGRFTAINIPLIIIIRSAYRLQDSQLIGAPEWVATTRYDITAKAEDDLPPPVPTGPPSTGMLMLQSLLEERFRLAVHSEVRELPIYALVVGQPNGRFGPNLKQSAVDCQAPAENRKATSQAPPFKLGERPHCGMHMGFGQITAGARPMTLLASALSQVVQRSVVDRTGLTGAFDFDVRWTPDTLPQRPPGTPADQPFRMNGLEIDPNGPSIFTAVQEQLGLKLESTRGPVEVLVIDHIERPTPD